MIHSAALIIADFLFSKDAIHRRRKRSMCIWYGVDISGIISVALVLIIGLINRQYMSMQLYTI
ncbi:MAG: hypothetical protein ACLTAT_11040 [Lachnospira eligens]